MEQADRPACESRSLAAPLFGAQRDPLELQRREKNAVAALTRSSARQPEVLCTGVLVAPDVVLTARHCAELLPEGTAPLDHVGAYFGAAIDLSDFHARVVRFEVHDASDLALAFLERAVSSEIATPLEPWASGDGELLAVGNEAILCGFGLREDDGFGRRQFLSEPIVELNAEEVVVDGEGRTGACIGDSGGPLLLRDAQGHHRVVGVLSIGSASCVDLDVYVRLEPARAWLDAALGAGDGC